MYSVENLLTQYLNSALEKKLAEISFCFTKDSFKHYNVYRNLHPYISYLVSKGGLKTIQIKKLKPLYSCLIY